MERLRSALVHPLARGRDVNDPQTTNVRRTIIHQKPFLKKIYEEWYGLIAERLPEVSGSVLELGSGAGFLNSFIPGLITSELLPCEHVRLILDGQSLPFRDGSLRAITMTNVLHHIPSPPSFLTEASRCLRPGGRIVAIEPWASWWARVIYPLVDHEPFDPLSPEWCFLSDGPLSGANGALPWIIFERDRARFAKEFPMLRVHSIQGLMPFRYLVSGGLNLRSLMPAWTFAMWRSLERALHPFASTWSMFAVIVIERR